MRSIFYSQIEANNSSGGTNISILLRRKLTCDRIQTSDLQTNELSFPYILHHGPVSPEGSESFGPEGHQLPPRTTNIMASENANLPPSAATEAVLVPSDEIPKDAQKVEEIDFNVFKGKPITVEDMLDNMKHMGFQASAMGDAVRIINNMRTWRGPEGEKTTIFLGYTSNMISSGLRGVFRYLVEHKHVDCIVTTAGGIEEDFIKCLGDTYMSSFSAPGAEMRSKGLNRIGNLMVPNANYCAFEDWVMPILDKMLEEQEATKGTDDEINWTPSKVIHRLGKEINDERSVYYWAYKNDIPVFCPALTDGSLGDMLYFHTYKASPLHFKIDIVEDIRRINTIAVRAKRSGMIILGGGVVKHHIANANLMRNGAEYAVYINTAQEFDGSDAGARPDEAISWGKIKVNAEYVKVSYNSTSLSTGLCLQIIGLPRGFRMLSFDRGEHFCQGQLR